MAVVEGDTFQVPIEIDDKVTQQVETIVRSLASAVKKIPTDIDMGNVEKQLDDATKAIKASAVQIQKLTESVQENNVAFVNAGKDQSDYNKISGETTKATEDLDGVFGSLTKNVSRVAASFAQITEVIENVTNAITFLSDPKKLKRLSDLLNIMAAFLRIKGKPQLAKSVVQISDQVEVLADKMGDLRETAEDMFEDAAQKARTFNSALEASRQTLDGVITAAAVFVGLKISGQLERVSRSFGVLGQATKSAEKSFFNLSATLGKKLSKNMLNVAKGSALAAPALISVGRSARESENEFVRLSGTMTIVAGILLGALSLAIVGVLKLFADFAVVVGDKLIKSMTSFEEKATKSARAVSQFQFVIKGFNRVVGEESVGSLDKWNQVIAEVSESSTASADSVRKSVKLLVAEGSRIGLTFQETSEIVKRATDIQAASGKDIVDVTQAIINALVGQGQAALSLGLDIREASVSHSELVESSGKSFKELSEGEKVIARLSEVFRQSQPVIGAAAADLDTVAGATEVLEGKLNDLQIRLGRQTKFTVAYTKALQSVVDVFLSLPAPVVEVTGALTDFFGVTLKVVGTIAKYALLVASLSTAYQVLNSALSTNVKLQTAVNLLFTRLGTSVNASTVQVTSLSGVMANLGAITKASLIGVFQSLLKLVGSVGLAMGKLALAVAPLIAKIVLIGVVVRGLFLAVKEIVPNLNGFKIVMETLGSAVDLVKDTFTEFFGKIDTDGISILSRLLLVVKNAAKILVSGLAAGLTTASLAWLKFRQAVFDNDEEAAATQKTINALTKDLDNLGNTIISSAVEISDVVSGQALAAVSAEGENVKSVLSGISDRFNEMGGHGKENAEEASNALKQLVSENASLALSISNMNATEAERIENNLNAAIANLDLKKKELQAEGLLTDAVRDQITEQRNLLGLQANQQLQNLEVERIKKTSDAMQRLMGQQNQFEIDRLAGEGQLVAAQELRNQVALEAFDKEAQRLKDNLLLREDELKVIEDTRKALVSKGEADVKAAGKQEQDAAEKALPQGEQLFGPKQVELISGAFGQGAGDIAGAASSFMGPATAMMGAANVILDGIQKMIDFIPQILDKISGVFNSLVDLPGKIVESLGKVISSIGRVIGELIPNLLKAIPQLVKQIYVDLPKTIQDAFIGLLDNLPDIIFEVIQSLLDAVPQIIDMMINMVPRMAIKLIEFIVKDAPKIAIAIVKAMTTDLAKALVDGVVAALSELGGMLSNLFKGVFDVGEISEEFKEIGDKISRASSQLFKVIDLEAEQRGLDVADRIRNAINSSTNRTKDILQKLWAALKKVWEFIRDKILMPVFNFLKKIWTALFNKVLKPIFDAAVKAFRFLFEKVVKPIWDAVVKVLKFLFEKVVAPIMNVFSKAMTFVAEKIVKPIFEAIIKGLTAVFEIVKPIFMAIIRVYKAFFVRFVKPIFTTVISLFKNLFQNIVKPIFEGIVSLFKNAFNGVKIIFQVVVDHLNNSWNAIKTIFQVFVDLFSGKISFLEAVSKIWDTVLSTFQNGLSIIFDGFKDIGKNFIDGLSIVWDTLKKVADGFINGLNIVWETLKNIFQPIIDGFKKAFSAIGGIFDPVINFFSNFKLPELKTPGWLQSFIDAIGKLTSFSLDFSTGGLAGKVSNTAKNVVGDVVSSGKDLGGDISTGFKKVNPFNTGGAVGPYGKIDIPSGKVVNGILHAQSGAFAQGTDTISANLTPGEFVVNREATRNNLGLLSFINKVQKPVEPLKETNNFSIVINAKTALTPDQIRREVVPTLEKELRRKSQQGRFVIAGQGIRN